MTDPIARWRLVLGDAASGALGPCETDRARDEALAFLYDREEAPLDAGRRGATPTEGATDDPSRLAAPRWLDDVHRLFPREAALRLERDAVERYGLLSLLEDPDVLARVEPSPTLLRAVLRTKHLMRPELLAAARALTARVVEELTARLRPALRDALAGPRRAGGAPRRVARNLDLKRTVLTNLRGYDPATRRLVIRRARFVRRARRLGERWQLVILVDQSGSMLGSTVHAAVTAACLHGLPALRRHLVTFDTSVVDLTAHVDDPVELLMRVALGGGTDIAQALRYGAGLLEDPRRALVVLISDLYEGGDPGRVVRQVEALREREARVLVLTALDEEATPRFDRDLARALVDAGAEVAAMTPAQLTTLVAEAVAG